MKKRQVEIWDVCAGTRTPSDFRIEKVLAKKNPYVSEPQYCEVVLSTSQESDLSALSTPCTANLMLNGNTEQVLYDVHNVTHEMYKIGSRWFITVVAEVWL